MAVSNFLFGNSPAPTSITGQTSSVSNLPDWYQDYTKQIIARGNAIASEPYTPYGGSRIAGLNDQDRAAGQVVQSNVGAYKPYISQASNSFNDASKLSGADAANPYLTQSAGMSGFQAGSPLINQGANGSSVAAAQPYTSAASQTWPSAMNDYMSPYTGAVVDEIGRLGSQNLLQNILPGVNQTFTGNGMFGSSNHANFTDRAIRDATTGIAGEQAKALEQGYGTSANIFGSDQNRLAGIGSTLGGLANSDYGRQLAGGQALGGLTSDDASRLANIGNIAGTLTQGDARNLIDIGSKQAGLGQTVQQLGTNDAAALSSLGEQQRGLTQNMLNSQYQDYLNEKNDPWAKLNNLSSLLRGQQLPTSSTTTTIGQGATSPTLASQLLGVGVGTNAMA